MKIYLIAGEASGDLHGSNLARAVLQLEPTATLRGWGGDLMADAGVQISKHYRELAFMGFLEVVMNLRTILRNFDTCKKEISEWKPDVIVLIDYPGFNLRMARWAKQQGIRVFYYISPQVWAWKENRVHQIIRDVDTLCVVLPFESDFYAKYQFPVAFVGHPLLDAVESLPLDPRSFRERNGLDERPVIALLPGSRKQEIRSMLPVMLEVANSRTEFNWVIAAAPSIDDSIYRELAAGCSTQPVIVRDQTYDLLRAAHAGLITSGTATLEAALFGLPQVVCYRGNTISYAIARKLVKVKYISLVNLILDRPAVKELIQRELHRDQLSASLDALVQDGPERRRLLADYDELRTVLGGPGASLRTARLLLKKPE